MSYSLEFKEVSKSFRTDFWKKKFLALNSISFSVPEGKIVGFLGANGAGKTTSLKILMGFIKGDAGQVQFSQSLGRNRKEVFRQLGFLPERPYFYPHLTGREFLTYMGRLSEVPFKLQKKQVSLWAERLKIEFALDRKVRGYSKGMLQRLGFVSVLIHDPQLIILDEPVSGLDPIGRKEIKDVIVELNKEGKTIFFSSHIVPDVEAICSSVIFLEKGELLFQGSIDKLIRENLRPGFIFKLKKEASQIETEHKRLSEVGDQFIFVEVSDVNKDKLIQECLQKNYSIEAIEHNKMTLEEILYKVRTRV